MKKILKETDTKVSEYSWHTLCIYQVNEQKKNGSDKEYR